MKILLDRFIDKMKIIFHQNNQQLLVLVRPVGSAGTKNYYVINSLEDLQHFIENREQSDSITVFNDFPLLLHGIINNELKQSLIQIIKTTKLAKREFLLIENYPEHGYYIDSINDLKEIIEPKDYGKEIYFLTELDWIG